MATYNFSLTPRQRARYWLLMRKKNLRELRNTVSMGLLWLINRPMHTAVQTANEWSFWYGEEIFAHVTDPNDDTPMGRDAHVARCKLESALYEQLFEARNGKLK